MGKNVDLSAYRKPYSKKQLKKGLIMLLIFGSLWFLVIMLPWLFWLKPYKEFGYYECEAIYNKNVFIVDAEHLKVVYEIDGVEYDKVIWYHTTRWAINELSFCYQLDNPYYFIMGDMSERDTLLIVFPCVASLGLMLCGWVIWFYKREIKKINDKDSSE